MTPEGIISAIIIGAVIGILGRLRRARTPAHLRARDHPHRHRRGPDRHLPGAAWSASSTRPASTGSSCSSRSCSPRSCGRGLRQPPPPPQHPLTRPRTCENDEGGLPMGGRLRAAGGAEGIRTPDLLIANETRYQLRHSPASGLKTNTSAGSDREIRAASLPGGATLAPGPRSRSMLPVVSTGASSRARRRRCRSSAASLDRRRRAAAVDPSRFASGAGSRRGAAPSSCRSDAAPGTGDQASSSSAGGRRCDRAARTVRDDRRPGRSTRAARAPSDSPLSSTMRANTSVLASDGCTARPVTKARALERAPASAQCGSGVDRRSATRRHARIAPVRGPAAPALVGDLAASQAVVGLAAGEHGAAAEHQDRAEQDGRARRPRPR